MASTKVKVESGIQLLSRLTKKKGIDGFYPTIFENGPKLGDIIEIYSEESTACLIADLICESLIPNDLDGPEASVIIFSTDGRMTLDYLMNLGKIKLMKCWKKSTKSSEHEFNVDFLVNSMFKNLFVLEIYDTTEFYTTIQNLDYFLTKYPKVSLIIFDSLTAFYWDEQNSQKVTKMDLYIKKLLRIIIKVVKDFKVTVMYSRPEYFSTSKEPIENLEPCSENSVIDQINYRIQTVYNENGEHHINVRTHDKQLKKEFNIINDEILWL